MITPDEIIRTAQLYSNVYLLGQLQPGITLYKQQARAHNLVWALTEKGMIKKGHQVAVIGGGAGGLTLASLLSLTIPTLDISIFERHSDLCPLQMGCDTRWLHPLIYEWPRRGSRQPDAMLPVLNWREGRASDVAAQLLEGFRQVLNTTVKNGKTANYYTNIFLEVGHIRIDGKSKWIEWVGRKTKFTTGQNSGHFQKKDSVGEGKKFDFIFICTGFGRETSPPEYERRLYWQNDYFGQPSLTDEQRSYLISGTGDGALVDLFRLTIERFRQDRVLHDLFGRNLELFEEEFRMALVKKELAEKESAERIAAGTGTSEKGTASWLEFFDSFRKTSHYFSDALKNLAKKIRHDTKVILHISGKDNAIKEFREALEQRSCVMNKLIAYLLYRNGAFTPACGELNKIVIKYGVPRGNVICRHGTTTRQELEEMFVSLNLDEQILKLAAKDQEWRPSWQTNYFPLIPSV